jgi:hypothetical protein
MLRWFGRAIKLRGFKNNGPGNERSVQNLTTAKGRGRTRISRKAFVKRFQEKYLKQTQCNYQQLWDIRYRKWIGHERWEEARRERKEKTKREREREQCIQALTLFRVSTENLTFRLGSLGRPRRRWEDNIKMDLKEIGFDYVDWIHLVQDRDRWRALVNTVMRLRVPWNAGNFLTSWAYS